MLNTLNESESVEGENNFDDERREKIKKDFNDKFIKLITKEIRRNLYEIENKNNLSTQKVKIFTN